MYNVLLIRPLEDAVPLGKILKSKGVESHLYPLFEPIFLPLPFLETPQALIITSKNALRAMKAYEELKEIPLYTVGDQTATIAQQMGFSKVLNASGTSRELTELILKHAHPEKGRLYHLSGELIKTDIVNTLQSKGFQAERHIVYRIQAAKDLPPPLLSSLQNKKISHVMFFSPHTTSIFVTLLKKNKLEGAASQIISLCLSLDVAQQASQLQWKDIWISPQPTTQNMTGYFDEEK